jgi:hypothetical protein
MEQVLPSSKPRSRTGCLGQFFLVLLVLVGGLLVYAGLYPWAFFMGGSFHPSGGWQGWGRMKSRTAGDYLLYVQIGPAKHSRHSSGASLTSSTSLSGSAYLCTPKGERFDLTLGGGMPRDVYVNSLGKPITVYMSKREILPLGQTSRLRFTLQGHWEQGQLVADDHKTLSAAFLPGGTLRQQGSTVLPSQTEDIPVILHEGSYSEFNAACGAIRHCTNSTQIRRKDHLSDIGFSP